MSKPILLKLSGETFSSKETLSTITKNIKSLLSKTTNIGIVIGGGNFFRGSKQGESLGLSPAAGHEVGMLATIMNGIILKEKLEKEGIKTILFSALQCSQIAETISQSKINQASKENKCMIFSGGTGNPFFTTDTNAVLRALQIGASEIWKATNVDGIYSSDPNENNNAELIRNISYKKVIEMKLGVMDLTAMTLAEQHDFKIRIFNVFKNNALINAYEDNSLGSTVTLAG